MYYVYLLKSGKDDGLYIGFTSDLKRRFSEHEAGQCRSTKHRRPLSVIYYEAFSSKADAKSREVYLKSGHGRKQLSKILIDTLAAN